MVRKLLLLIALLLPAPAWATTYNVGPGQTYTTFAALHAAVTVQAGDIVDGGNNIFYERVVPNGPATYRNFILDGTLSFDGTYSYSGSSYVSGYPWTQVGTTEIYRKTMSRTPYELLEDGVLMTPVVSASAPTSNADLARGEYSYYGAATLYYRATNGADPSTHAIRGSNRTLDSPTVGLLYIYGIDGLTMDNVIVRHFNSGGAGVLVGVYVENSSNITFTSFQAIYCKAGVTFRSVDDSSIDANSSVSYNYTEGLRVEGGSDRDTFSGSYSYNGRAKYYEGTTLVFKADGDGIGVGGIGGTMTDIVVQDATLSYNGATSGDQWVGDEKGAGMYVGSAYTMAAGVSLYRSQVYENHAFGLFFDGTDWTGGVIAYNVIRDNLDYGSADVTNAIDTNCQNAGYTSAAFYNNVIARNYGNAGLRIGCSSKPVTLRNNIFYNNGRTGTFRGDLYFGSSTLTNITESNNLFYRSGTGWDSARVIDRNGTTYDRTHIVGTSAGYWQYDTGKGANDIGGITDPLFVSLVTPDFSLQAGSPAINAGVDVGLTMDIQGTSIVAPPNMGAYEESLVDTTPDAFSFTDNVNVGIYPATQWVYSDSIEVADIDDDTSIDISGASCEYQVNGTGGWLTSGDNVVLGNTVALRVPPAPTYSTPRACTLTLGDTMSDTWYATTIAAAAVNYVPIPPRMRAHLRQRATFNPPDPPADPGSVGHIAPTAAQSVSESPYSNNGWTSPESIYSAGEASITAATFDAGDLSYVLKGYGFNFSAIPDGATIDGVEVIINARHGNDVSPVNISLAQLLNVSRAKVGDNQYSSPQTLTTSAAEYVVGGAADTWGNSLTTSWVKDADFGVALGFTAGGSGNSNNKVYVDSVTMKVWYTP
jgi:hypothetical protein